MEEVTWELELEIREKYPQLFATRGKFKGRNFFKGGGLSTPTCLNINNRPISFVAINVPLFTS